MRLCVVLLVLAVSSPAFAQSHVSLFTSDDGTPLTLEVARRHDHRHHLVWGPPCEMPCALTLASGTWAVRLGSADGGHGIVPRDIDGFVGGAYEAHFESRASLRTLGVVGLVFGVLLTVGTAIAGFWMAGDGIASGVHYATGLPSTGDPPFPLLIPFGIAGVVLDALGVAGIVQEDVMTLRRVGDGPSGAW